MAKKSIILSNDDGRQLASNTSLLAYDNSTQYVSIDNISASQFVVTGANNAIFLNSSGVITTKNAADNSASYVITDGTKWTVGPATNLAIGTAAGDLSGSYPNPVFKNISNVVSGGLPITRGGLSGSGAVNILNAIPSGSLILANSTNTVVAVSTASYNGSGDWVLGAVGNGATWGAVTASAPARDANLQYFTCSVAGTSRTVAWTKASSNHRWARIMLQAGGGGGGGNSVFPGGAAAGGGGGGGFTDIVVYLGSTSTGTVTVGAGGGGSSGPAIGTSGASSSFSASNIFVSAQGGTGGTYNANTGIGGIGITYIGGAGGAGGTSQTAGVPSVGASGGGGGANAAGTEKASGNAGLYTNDTAGSTSSGGYLPSLFNYNVPFGFGTGGGGGPSDAPGKAGIYGGGGGGAAKQATAGFVTGGSGGDGFVIILSY